MISDITTSTTTTTAATTSTIITTPHNTATTIFTCICIIYWNDVSIKRTCVALSHIDVNVHEKAIIEEHFNSNFEV